MPHHKRKQLIYYFFRIEIAMDENDRNIVILYGSQTGTAQEVAERICREAKRLHFNVVICSMDGYKPIGNLIKQKLVVFVCSTTGQGDEPDNMKLFWKFLLRKSLPSNSLESMKFGVLGLGDSSYQKYNFVGKRLYKRLRQLGGNDIVPLGLGDEQHDLGHDHVIDPWLKELWERALDLMPLPYGLPPIPANVTPPSKYNMYPLNTTQILEISNYKNNTEYNQSHPFMAQLISCDRVTSKDHFQDTRLVELDIKGSGITFMPGDVCMIRPNNLKENVEFFFQLFPNLDPDMLFTLKPNDNNNELPESYVLPMPCSLMDCVERLWDIQSIPGRYFFELLSHFAPNTEDGLTEKEKLLELSSAEGQQDLYDYCNRPRRNRLEVMYDFRHTRPNIPLEYLFDLFPNIKPRAFSIASSYHVMPDKIQLLIAVVSFKTKTLVAPRLGLCSNWLSRLAKDRKVPIWIKKGTLTFPESTNAPVVMIGPGTGIAPFRAYASKEMNYKSNRERRLVVYFGCRNKHKDFYFEAEWTKMQEHFNNFSLFTAFSRDGSEDENKTYVQHVMKENSELLYKLICEEKGYFYIAGNSKLMPDAVTDALKEALRTNGNFNDMEAINEYITKMELQKRFQTETWS